MKARFTIILSVMFFMVAKSFVSGQVLKARLDYKRQIENQNKTKNENFSEKNTNKAPDTTFDASGFGDFIFNKAKTVQSFNLLASITTSDTFKISKKDWVSIFNINSKLYGLQKASTEKQDSIGLALLIPENSAWGIQLSFAKMIVKIKEDSTKRKLTNFALAAGAKFDYATKNIDVRDSNGKVTSNYQIGQFLIRPGLEIAFKNLLSIYGNWNWNAMITGIDDFEKIFENTKKNNFNYVDFGLRGMFLLAKDSKTTINLDFNFIYVNSDVRMLQNTNDKVIPLIRVGLNQSLYFK